MFFIVILEWFPLLLLSNNILHLVICAPTGTWDVARKSTEKEQIQSTPPITNERDVR